MWTCLSRGEGQFIHLYESSATVLIAHSRLLRLISQAISAFSRDFLCYWWLGRIPIKLQLTSKSCLILDFVVNVLEILVWYEKRLVGACVDFPLKNHERKEAGEYVRKKNGLSIWDSLSSHLFFCYLDGNGKVLKLLCDVWKEVISKWKRLYKQFRVLSCNCLGDWCIWCYFWRMQVACRRAQTNWIVYFYRVIALSSYRWSFEVLAFRYAFFRASAASAVYFQFWQKIKVYRSLCFVSKVFFDMTHNRQGWLPK